jgi:hypothetical protein
MADNTHLYGFRWAFGYGGKSMPMPIRKHVATAQDDVDDAAVSCAIYPGDPVKLMSTGGVKIALTTEAVYGIVVGIAPYWDGTRMVRGNKLPNATTWGTVEERRSYVYVVPATAGFWEIDCDVSAAAYDTKAEYQAFIGENAEHVVPGGTFTGVAPTDSCDPYLDISTHNTTEGLGWRIEDISQTEHNQDFSGEYVKLIVSVNDSLEATSAATVVVGV